MSSTRLDPKTVEFTPQLGDELIQSAFLPNGNLLCMYRYKYCVINPENGAIVAESHQDASHLPLMHDSIYEDRYAGIPRLYPISNEDFLLLPYDDECGTEHIYRFKINNGFIRYIKKTLKNYFKVFARQDQVLVALQIRGAEKVIVDIIDSDTLEILETGCLDRNITISACCTLLPSGRFVRYDWDSEKFGARNTPLYYGHISVYKHPLDITPVKEIRLREYVHIHFGGYSQAITENIVIYLTTLKSIGIYFIHNLETDQIVKLHVPKGCRYLLTPLADNKTLIAVKDTFYLLDNEKMTLDSMAANPNVGREQKVFNQGVGKRCTSVTSRMSSVAEKKGHETIALTFREDNKVYISNELIDREKILGEVMAGVPKFSRDVAGVVLSYFGLGLFSGSVPRVLKAEELENEKNKSAFGNSVV